MSIKEKKFKKLFKELQFHKSEHEFVLEILKAAHWDFEEYYKEYCEKKDINLAKLAAKASMRGAKPLNFNHFKIPLMKNLITRTFRDS